MSKHKPISLSSSQNKYLLTCIEEESINERAVTEEGAHWCDIFKVAVTKGRVDEGDRLQLHIDESKEAQYDNCSLVSI